MAGYPFTSTTYADIDYSEYLGPNWKKEYEGASTLIGNHVSWFDAVFAIVYYFPTIVARDTLQKTPFIGSVLKAMSTIFLARVGDNAAESKRLAAQQFQDHQKKVESGEYTTPVIIYPEGATTRQSEMI